MSEITKQYSNLKRWALFWHRLQEIRPWRAVETYLYKYIYNCRLYRLVTIDFIKAWDAANKIKFTGTGLPETPMHRNHRNRQSSQKCDWHSRGRPWHSENCRSVRSQYNTTAAILIKNVTYKGAVGAQHAKLFILCICFFCNFFGWILCKKVFLHYWYTFLELRGIAIHYICNFKLFDNKILLKFHIVNLKRLFYYVFFGAKMNQPIFFIKKLE